MMPPGAGELHCERHMTYFERTAVAVLLLPFALGCVLMLWA
jgi:hypothetical protein